MKNKRTLHRRKQQKRRQRDAAAAQFGMLRLPSHACSSHGRMQGVSFDILLRVRNRTLNVGPAMLLRRCKKQRAVQILRSNRVAFTLLHQYNSHRFRHVPRRFDVRLGGGSSKARCRHRA